MSLPRFFLEHQVLGDAAGTETIALELTPDDAKHLKVLRLREGEHIAVVDAATDYFECEIVDALPQAPVVRICQREIARSAPFDVTLVQGLCKGDKMEDVIRHASEVGVSRFIPFESARSVVKVQAGKREAKAARWRAIAKSAAMQSGLPGIPAVEEPVRLKRLAEALSDYDKVLVFWEEATATDTIERGLQGVRFDSQTLRIAAVVGPEGGFSEDEVNALLSLPHAAACTLGPTILRTETAGIVAPALVRYELFRMMDAQTC